MDNPQIKRIEEISMLDRNVVNQAKGVGIDLKAREKAFIYAQLGMKLSEIKSCECFIDYSEMNVDHLGEKWPESSQAQSTHIKLRVISMAMERSSV